VQLGGIQETLRGEGVETLAIVIGPADRARLYVRYRPTRVLLLADPEASVHGSFGVPRVEIAEGEAGGGGSQWPHRVRQEDFLALRINPTGELPEPKSPFEASRLLNQRDGYQFTESDKLVGSPRHPTGRTFPHRSGRRHPLDARRGRGPHGGPCAVPERGGVSGRGAGAYKLTRPPQGLA